MSQKRGMTIEISGKTGELLLEEAQRLHVDPNTLTERLLQQILPHEKRQALDPDDWQALTSIYHIPKPNEVINFLERYPFLIPLLLEAKLAIDQHFLDDPLFLMINIDPDDGTEQLALEIDSDISDSEEIIDRLEMIYDDPWWNGARVKSQSKMLFTLH